MEGLNELRLLSLETRSRLMTVEYKLDELTKMLGNGSSLGHPDQFFGGRTYAQHGDDLVMMCIFHTIGVAKPSYLDIGAHHPFNISNTALLYLNGSRGINVEANPNLFQAFNQHRPDDTNVNLGVGPVPGVMDFYMIDERSGRNTFDKSVAEAFIKSHPNFSITQVLPIEVVTINQIIEQHCNGFFPDLLSIDVEGLDAAILRSADFSKSKPKVICVEIENAAGSDGKDEIRELLTERGYFIAFRAISNAIYVENEYRALLT